MKFPETIVVSQLKFIRVAPLQESGSTNTPRVYLSKKIPQEFKDMKNVIICEGTAEIGGRKYPALLLIPLII